MHSGFLLNGFINWVNNYYINLGSQEEKMLYIIWLNDQQKWNGSSESHNYQFFVYQTQSKILLLKGYYQRLLIRVIYT